MDSDSIIQDLSVKIYEDPLNKIREEHDFPNLNNLLHMVVILIDCDTEIDINGIFGYLENLNGRYFPNVIKYLKIIGSQKTAAIFEEVVKCMEKHNVTWQRLRSDFNNVNQYEITSFQKLHGENINEFTNEAGCIIDGLSLFNTLYSPEDNYKNLTNFLDKRIEEFEKEIEIRTAKKKI